MAIAKTRNKIAGRPRKVLGKKAKRTKSNMQAINRAMKIADKYNLDLNYIKE